MSILLHLLPESPEYLRCVEIATKLHDLSRGQQTEAAKRETIRLCVEIVATKQKLNLCELYKLQMFRNELTAKRLGPFSLAT